MRDLLGYRTFSVSDSTWPATPGSIHEARHAAQGIVVCGRDKPIGTHKKKLEPGEGNANLPPVEKEHWDIHYDPKIVPYTKFHARRRIQEKDKRVSEIEEKREKDEEDEHDPWLD